MRNSARMVFLPLLAALLLAAGASAHPHNHQVFIVNQTNAGPCLGDGFAGETGHTYGGNFTNITDLFTGHITTTAGFASSSVAAGDEIRVCQGAYRESVTMNRTVTLKANNTSYDATVNSTLDTSDGITVAVNNANISYLKVQNATATDRAAFNVSASDANISYNTLLSSRFGIYVKDGSPNTTILNNTITNISAGLPGSPGHGVRVNASNNTALKNNTVTGGAGAGAYLFGATNTTIANNTLDNHSLEGAYVNNSPNTTLKNNTIRNNTDGVRILNASNSTNITGNTIRDNSQNGVLIETPGSDLLRVTDNNLYSNSLYNIQNAQPPAVNATLNWWDTLNCASINYSIYDGKDNAANGLATMEPYLDGSYPGGSPVYCSTQPEVVSVTLNTSTVGFGSLNPGTENATATTGYPVAITIQSTTNIATNITVAANATPADGGSHPGGNFTLSGHAASPQVNVSALNFSNASNFTARLTLSTTRQGNDSFTDWQVPSPDGGPNENRDFYMNLTLPAGTQAGSYHAHVTLRVSKQGT